MNGVQQEIAITAKLRLEGCTVNEAGRTPASIAFVYKGRHFFIPVPPENGYTPQQLARIEAELEYLGLELLPLDAWMS